LLLLLLLLSLLVFLNKESFVYSLADAY